MIRNATYRQITGPEGLLSRCEPFKGNSLSAEWNGNTYEVRSYSTIIATHNRDTEITWINTEKYSVTTSKQQNYVNAWIAREFSRTNAKAAA